MCDLKDYKMKIGTRSQLALIILLFVGLLLGCSSKTSDLAGTAWELTSLNGKDLIEDTAITLHFDDGYLGGEMGCNGYGGSPDTGGYIAKRDGSFSLIPPFAVTVQLCSEPEGIMEQEAEYIEVFERIARFQREGDLLELLDAAGETTLIFIER